MKIKSEQINIYSQVESILGCKWSLLVLKALASGKKRPGEIRKSIAGISEKVLNERFKKFVRFKLVEKHVFPEIPPHVEYTLTAKGKSFSKVIQSINRLAT